MGILDSGRRGLGMWLPYDNEEGGGYGFAKLNPEHPFYAAWARHDQIYKEILLGTATKTLAQYDREALNNCLRIAAKVAFLNGVSESVRLAKDAWWQYRVMRWWAKNVRPELEAYKPAFIKK